VISAKDDSECCLALKHRSKDGTFVQVPIGALDTMEKADVVRKELSVHSKKLDESTFNNQVNKIIIRPTYQK